MSALFPSCNGSNDFFFNKKNLVLQGRIASRVQQLLNNFKVSALARNHEEGVPILRAILRRNKKNEQNLRLQVRVGSALDDAADIVNLVSQDCLKNRGCDAAAPIARRHCTTDFRKKKKTSDNDCRAQTHQFQGMTFLSCEFAKITAREMTSHKKKRKTTDFHFKHGAHRGIIRCRLPFFFVLRIESRMVLTRRQHSQGE